MQCMSFSSHHIQIKISGKTDNLKIVVTAFTIYDILVMGELTTKLL
jgi:hypothetical protein